MADHGPSTDAQQALPAGRLGEALTTIACSQCGSGLQPGVDAWRCNSCGREQPALLGIPDFRPEPAPPSAQALQLRDAYAASDFAALLRIRQPQFSTSNSRLVGHYAAYRERMAERGNRFYEMVQRRMGARYPAPKHQSVLVVGCGVGASLMAVARDFDQVIGLDPSLEDLILARKALDEARVDNVMLVQGYAQQMPLRDGSIDFAIAEDVVEHLHDIEGAFRDIQRVLAEGGQFAASSVNRFNLLRPEPHVKLWLLGSLPRRLQAPYARWRRGFANYDQSVCLPSYRRLRRALKASWGEDCGVIFPGMSAYDMPVALDRVLAWLEPRHWLAVPLLAIFPVHLAVARRN
jgi:SAM-dependent methyltransferase